MRRETCREGPDTLATDEQRFRATVAVFLRMDA